MFPRDIFGEIIHYVDRSVTASLLQGSRYSGERFHRGTVAVPPGIGEDRRDLAKLGKCESCVGAEDIESGGESISFHAFAREN